MTAQEPAKAMAELQAWTREFVKKQRPLSTEEQKLLWLALIESSAHEYDISDHQTGASPVETE